MLRTFLLCIFAINSLAYGADWSSCESDLERIARYSKNLRDLSERLQSNANDLEQTKDEIEDCSFKDNSSYCTHLRNQYKHDIQLFQNEFLSIKSEFHAVESKVRASEISCDTQIQKEPARHLKGASMPECSTIMSLAQIHGDQYAFQQCVAMGKSDTCHCVRSK